MENFNLNLAPRNRLSYFTDIGVFNLFIFPNCNNQNIKKNGKTNKGTQRYYCKNCFASFNSYTLTFFNRMSIVLDVLDVLLIYYLVGLTSKQTKILIDFNFSHNYHTPVLRTVQRYYDYFRKLSHYHMVQIITEFQLEEEVEIDEALIFKKKHRGGRRYMIQYWVMGMRQRNSNKFIIFPVIRRTREIIFSYIISYITLNIHSIYF